MKVLVLSYFDNVLGPRIFLKAPESVEDKEIESIPSLMDLNEKGFFVHITDKYKSANLIFNLPSKYARGKKEILLISIVTDINSDINLNLSRDLLETFSRRLKKIEDGYKAFYDKSSKYEFDDEKLYELENTFYTFYNSFKSTIKALKEAELRYKTLFEQARDAILIVDYRTEEILDINKQAENILGIKRDDLKGAKPSILNYTDDYNKIKESVIIMVKKENAHPMETYIKSINGSNIPVEYSASEIKFGGKRLLQIIFRDITERKEAEKKIKASEKELFNENKKLSALFGISRLAENTYLSLDEMFEVTLKLVQGAFNSPDHVEVYVSYNNKEYKTEKFNEKLPVISSSVMVNEEKLILSATYSNNKSFTNEENYLLYDITNRIKQILISRKNDLEREKMQKEIMESEKKYRIIIENALEGIWVIDHEANTTLINSTMAELLGYDKDEIMGKNLNNFINKKDRKEMDAHIKKRKKGVIEVYEFNFISKKGNPVLTHLRASPLYDSEGNYKGSIAFISRVNERKLS